MSFLKTLFGPSRKEVWRQLSEELDGQFHDGGLFGHSAVQARAGDWIITLDTFTEGNGRTSQTYTRVRAPFFNPEGFRFEIYRAGLLTGLGKAFGMQDIRVGHRRFDRDFVIKGNSRQLVRRLLDNEKTRRGIEAQRRIHLSVKGRDGWFGRFPAGVHELHFRADGVIKDLAPLRSLFDIFGEILRDISRGGTADPDDIRIHVRRLSAPGGRVARKYILWEGDGPRRDAAVQLGRLGNPAAIPALAEVLWSKDGGLRARAIDALAEIRHGDAAGPLIGLLGDDREAAGRRVQGRVADALRKLGEGELVDTVLGALDGDFGRLKAWRGESREYRAQIIEALGHALERFSGPHAANALAEIHAVEALPRLREVLRSTRAGGSKGQAISSAVQALEARAALPRAASATDVEADTLPRSAGAPGPDPGTLPRGSRAP